MAGIGVDMTARRVGLHRDDAHLAHDVPDHPESPDRVVAIVEGLRRDGLLDRLAPIPERAATDAELQLVHHPELVSLLRKLDAAGGAALDPDTTLLSGSFNAAIRAVGGALNAIDAVLDEGGAYGRAPLQAAFCLDRPPGHHATPTRPMGFCFFNQAAIAARYAQRVHGVDKVAIVDFDVHHGNGDAEYAASFERVIVPAVRRFEPELIVVSAGFDAHLADPLADMALTEAGYAFMAARICDLADEQCGGRTVWVLEGGYRLEALARSVARVMRVLLGDEDGGAIDAPPREDVARLLEQAAALHER